MCVILTLVVAYMIKTDYNVYGVALIIIMYLLEKPAYQCLAVVSVLAGSKFTICGSLASVPILLYNGERGFIRGRVWKYAFYAIYPLHMLVLKYVVMPFS